MTVPHLPSPPVGPLRMTSREPVSGRAVARCHENGAEALRRAIVGDDGHEIVAGTRPCHERMKERGRTPEALRVGLAEPRSRITPTEARMAASVEGRDAAGEGDAPLRPSTSLGPHVARIVAPSAPAGRDAEPVIPPRPVTASKPGMGPGSSLDGAHA